MQDKIEYTKHGITHVATIQRVVNFRKVSFEQYLQDFKSCYDDFRHIYHRNLNFHIDGEPKDKDFVHFVRNLYDKIELPRMATRGSAGNDVYTPLRNGGMGSTTK